MRPIEVVDALNELIWGKDAEHEKNFHLSFTYVYGTTFESILFEEHVLWCSENEERCWSEENQDYEDLLQYCIGKFKELSKTRARLNKLLTPKVIKYDCTKCKNSFMNPFDQYFCQLEEYDVYDNDCKGVHFKLDK